MKIIILTHEDERHYYFCNKIIKNTNHVVGVITGGKNRKLSKYQKRKIYKKNLFYLIRNKILNTIFYKYNNRLLKEKKTAEKQYFGGESKLFHKNYNHLLIGSYKTKYNSINDDYYVSLIKQKNPDVIVVMGTCLLGKKIISSAKNIINIHTGLSPYYRGGWTNLFPIIDDKYGYFGVTIHKMSTGIDSGDIIYSSRPDVHEDDNYSTINCKTIIIGTSLMIKAINQLEKSELNAIKQWTKGKLIMSKDYNGFSAFKYFFKIKNYMSRYIELHKSKLLPLPHIVDNGKKINDIIKSK